MKRALVLALLSTISVVSACGGGASTQKPADEKAVAPSKPLYQRLGGLDAIKAVVDDFIGNVAGDGRINARFANANIPHLKSMLVDQICQATGGPCTYAGKSMADAHAGMKITDAEFTALVEDLVKSLDKFHVGAQEKSELLGALGGMKDQIVNK